VVGKVILEISRVNLDAEVIDLGIRSSCADTYLDPRELGPHCGVIKVKLL
jgi:hypothetical protein